MAVATVEPSNDLTRFTTDEPITGYKIVTSVYGPPVMQSSTHRYVVGSRHKLDASDAPLAAACGFHFARQALALLYDLDWRSDNRLVQVEAPAGATLSTNGVVWATDDLRIVADVTADARSLLTGVLRVQLRFNTVWYSFVDGVAAAPPGLPVSSQAASLGWPRIKTWRADSGGTVQVRAWRGSSVVTVVVNGRSRVEPLDGYWGQRLTVKEWYE
jgi:hypothetical protein